MDTSSTGLRRKQCRTVKAPINAGACAEPFETDGMALPFTAQGKLKLGTYICLWLNFVLLLAGCGAPGEPVPPTPPIPTAITDLSALQAGDGVTLNFTMSSKSVAGDKLTEVPTMEILRGSLLPDGTVDPKSFHVVDTVPGAMIASYTEKGKVRFLDPVAPEEIRAHPGATVVYRVRARISDKKTSADSNDASLKLFVVAAPIEDFRANLTEDGIELTWTPPAKTSGGEPISGIEQYHVYRGEIDPSSAQAAGEDLSHAVWKSPLVQIASTITPEYRDAAFDYGKTYVYVVRGTLSGAAAGLESNDSHSVILTPKDTFPPAAPRGVVAAVLLGAEAGKFVVDLSWEINVEADLAGYRVYRSEQQGVRGTLITPELLLTPAYRDGSAASGQHNYWYTVTAVDRAGNESGPSDQISAEITQPSP
jgi:hypothetical protein